MAMKKFFVVITNPLPRNVADLAGAGNAPAGERLKFETSLEMQHIADDSLFVLGCIHPTQEAAELQHGGWRVSMCSSHAASPERWGRHPGARETFPDRSGAGSGTNVQRPCKPATADLIANRTGDGGWKESAIPVFFVYTPLSCLVHTLRIRDGGCTFRG
ncbi:predicted protein [Chaetomium globosum CBS 148.51]|uniref:Uncharacterized protein n=1 Tax=Chaetomium globosum (strain ATCC 6205 / CBS 148.51 / DSM 1962 / NBRC 6347 / NRRL 1970) TaxID=306901 RepID=Q2GTW8_CHAGB|nr:uncharacterized protein CHGG_08586 [Chaetomium globosum CBS 148.51]EAQ84572.1 predicted protein [Chaetomium globosum CBS 148.51]